MSIEKTVSQVLGATVARATRVFGGDVNETYRLEMATGSPTNANTTNDHNNSSGIHNPSGSTMYFLKLQRGASAEFYAAEVEGLRLLSAVARTPTVVRVEEVHGDAYLIMTYIHSTPHRTVRRNTRALGRMIAVVHKQKSPNGHFGAAVPILFAGSRTPAGWSQDWATCYITMRLMPLVETARKRGLWSSKRDALFAAFSKRFYAFYACENNTNGTNNPDGNNNKDDTENMGKYEGPSLLHGDLWGGNVMYGGATGGDPYLIDPSSYYGHREVDIAMTRLFGGFDDDFYNAYNEVFPLAAGYELRVPWYQLLPLLCHLLLFGETYGGSVDAAMRHVI